MERTADVRVPAARCPYCHEEVARGEEPAVCPACHALHHVACMSEHGACSACGAEHPRFAKRPVRTAARQALGLGPMLDGALALLFGCTLLGALIAAAISWHKNDVGVAWVVAFGGLAGLVGVVRRSKRAGIALAALCAAAGLLLLLWASAHVAANHATITLAWAAILGTSGALALLWPASAAPEPSKKGD